MPIYEFYCPDCHTVYSFFSAAVNTEARPDCPKCGRKALARRPSRFATVKLSGADDTEADADDPFAGVDEERMERAMEALGAEFEGMDENAEPDPREMSRMLRRFSEITGLEAGPKLREMLARLERGEDPESLEDELGGGEGDDEEDLSEFFALKKKLAGARSPRPRVDETLYFL
jgi:putative FmdB family regulatory protein